MPKDMGKNRIRAMEADRPGIEPKMMPMTTPSRISARHTGLNRTI